MIKLIMIIMALSGVTMSGVGVQSGETSFMTTGFALLAGTVVLFIVSHFIMKAVGCLIVIAILLLGGYFGLQSMGLDFSMLMGMMSPASEEASDGATDDTSMMEFDEWHDSEKGNDVAVSFSPDLVSPSVVKTSPQPTNTFSKQNYAPQAQPQPQYYNPQQQGIFGQARVVNGDTIQVAGKLVRLFGIDAPEPNQMCSAGNRRSYRCGQKAAEELRRMLGNSEISCQAMEENSKGHVIGTCSLGAYDIGAAIVTAGWAVAYREFSTVYVPYEEQAKEQKVGLWEGEFYMPWDWRKQSRERPNIRVIQHGPPKKELIPSGSGMLGIF